MKKSKIIILAISIAMLFIILGTVAFATSGEEIPTLKIEAANLSFDDSVYVLYAVSHNGIEAKDITMLFWSEPQADLTSYVKGTENYSKSAADLSETVKGADCVIFENDELRAKNMADYVYARAYAVVDGVEYYSQVSKYSILQYAYNKLGYTGTESTDTALKNMLTSMLNYGADAQEYFSHNTARPANGTFYQIKVEGGTLEDGFTKGLYLATETATLTAPEKSGNLVFAGWKNSAGEIYSTDNPLPLTDFSANETYTATYEESVTYSEGLKYTISADNTYYIVAGIGTCTDTEIVIPSAYNGLPVKEIGDDAFYDCTSLTSVTIPDSVETLGEFAFAYCSELSELTLGNSIKLIGDCAFLGCRGLTSVTIPDSVTSIGHAAFYDCWGLTSILVAEGNSTYKSIDGNLYSADGKTLILYAPGKTNESFTIPDSVTSIGDHAFEGCSGLTSVTIGNGVTSIGERAFQGCYGLTSVTIGNSVTSIGNWAFYFCDGLTSVTIPDSVTSIGNGAFMDCTSLASVIMPDSVTRIGDYAFDNCTSLTSVTIPNGVTTIGNYAFRGCTSLTSVTIGNSVTSIGECAFQLCNSLASVTFEENSKLTSIENYAFWACSNLTNVSFGENCELENIGDYAFCGCDSLTSVIIPDSVKSIGECAFSDCTSLASVVFGENSRLITISNAAFANCTSLESITIPDSVTSIGHGAFSDCTSLASVTFEENSKLTSIGNFAFRDCTSLTNVSFGENCELITISNAAFANCTSLTSVTIPDNVTSIDISAFNGCTSLRSVIIPNSVTNIGDSAFYRCDNLTIYAECTFKPDGWNSSWNPSYCPVVWGYTESLPSSEGLKYTLSEDEMYYIVTGIGTCTDTEVVIPSAYNGLPVKEIGDSAFRGCTSLTSITNPDSVTSIGNFAFRDCTSLTSVTIGNSVTSIGKYAFYNCTALEEIYFNATAMNDLSSSNYVFDNAGKNGNGIKVVIGKNVTKIPAYLFYPYSSSYSPKIVSVEFEEGGVCTSIGDSAFYYCTSLTSVTIGNNVTSIGEDAFYYCTSLTSITIPDSVTSIGNSAFSCCTSLTSITIPDNVTSIGNSAFSVCTSLTSITIPDNVTSIGEGAFYYCTSLTIYCEATSKPSGWNDYWNSSNRPVVWGYTESLPFSEGLKYTLSDDETYYIVTGIGTCTDTEVVIPSSYDGLPVKEIGDSAFEGCSSLTSITIPDSVTSIGDMAFCYCYKLVEVINKSSLNITKGSSDNGYVAYYAKEVHTGYSKIVNKDGYLFYTYGGINYLIGYVGDSTDLILPENYNGESYEIYKYAFAYCDSLTSVTIGNSVISIGDWAFYYCTSLTSVTIGNGVTIIGYAAFAGCISLTIYCEATSEPSGWNDYWNSSNRPVVWGYTESVPYSEGLEYTLSDDGTYYIVTGIGTCTDTEVVIPSAYNGLPVKEMGAWAFGYCNRLTSVIIPDGVTSIGSHAFRECSSLTSVTIPDSVTNIRVQAFAECTSLTNVTIPDSVTMIEELAFWHCSLTSITVSNENTTYKSVDGNLYSKNGKTLIQYAIGKTDSSFTIPNSVENIGRSAFEYCVSLTSVTIPDSVTSIGYYAFLGCDSLMSVTIGNSVTSIGGYAFLACDSLTSINVGNENTTYKSINGNLYSKDGKTFIQYATGKTDSSFIIPNGVTSIGYDAFKNCTNLTSVTIPDSVTSIGNYAFSGCTSLTSVTISDSVTSISYGAFYNCTSLTSIKYSGTEEQWNAITKGSSWDYNTGSYTITYNYTEE